jgi:D-alanine--poly(phosphoribitol) ligase subunit 1
MSFYIDNFLSLSSSQPQHPAVVEDGRTVSYGELAAKAAAYAGACQGLDAPKVLIALPQGADAYAAMLGCGIAGGYYAPINISAPAEKIGMILSRFAPDLVVGEPEFVAGLGLPPAVRTVDPAELPPAEMPPVRSHQFAYVIFTSGSTGVPKGVQIRREGLDNYVRWIGSAMQVGPHDRWSQHPNIGFDLSVMDIYGALCHGATLYPLTSDGDRVLPALAIARHQLTIWDSVPSVINLMIQARQMTAANLASLRLLTFCGEPLLLAHLDAIFAARPDVLVQNTYGPTEATVSCTELILTQDNYRDLCGSSVAIGNAISNMRVDLIGGDNPDEGELVLSGPQLAEGYWQDELGTARAFRKVTLDGRETRAYFTGDWAERRNGAVYFRERIDNQVKIGGFRIELDEITEAVRDCGWNNVCVVKAGTRLIAVLERVTGKAVEDGALRQLLAAKIADYAIPHHFLEVEQLPRNDNDKVDRRAVSEMLRRQGWE